MRLFDYEPIYPHLHSLAALFLNRFSASDRAVPVWVASVDQKPIVCNTLKHSIRHIPGQLLSVFQIRFAWPPRPPNGPRQSLYPPPYASEQAPSATAFC